MAPSQGSVKAGKPSSKTSDADSMGFLAAAALYKNAFFVRDLSLQLPMVAEICDNRKSTFLRLPTFVCNIQNFGLSGLMGRTLMRAAWQRASQHGDRGWWTGRL